MNIFDKFFYPGTICIPGASSKEKSIGYELLKTIKSYHYTGTVLPVNPNAAEILGYPCFPSVEEIREAIDLAIIVVPKKYVMETVEALLKKGARALILITAGFKETGEAGKKAEEEVREVVRSYGARLVGPNCMGIINSLRDVRLNATFVAEHPKESRSAFLSQSGALGAAVLNGLRETDVSFGHFISVGNKADVNENDLLEYWMGKDDITAAAMYLESFVDGRAFIEKILLQKYTKPLVVVKAGRTAAGSRAASSHTGALASSERVTAAIMKQFGIIRADTINEMFNTLKAYENFPLPKGNSIAVLTNAGGPAILCVDALEKAGLKLAELSSSTKAFLREFVHPEGSVENPVDLLPGGTAEQYRRANELLLADANVDAVVSVFVEPVMVPAMPVIEGINSLHAAKPLYQVCMPLPEFWAAYRQNSPSGRPVFRNAEDPAPVIANLLAYQQRFLHRAERLNMRPASPAAAESGWLSQQEMRALCEKYGIPLVWETVIRPEQLPAAAASLEYPVVCKGTAKGITHKTEHRLVELNIPDALALIAKGNAMSERCLAAGAELTGFLIQPYLTPRFELLIGGYRDTTFGPVVMFGTGGKYVEVWDDTATRSAYLCERDLDEMIDETTIGALLRGTRGEAPADIESVKKVIRACAQIMLDHDEIMELDCNPLLVTEQGTLRCVDIRVRARLSTD